MAKYFQIKNSKINKIIIREPPYVTPYQAPPYVNPLYVAPRYGIANMGGQLLPNDFPQIFIHSKTGFVQKFFSVKFSLVPK